MREADVATWMRYARDDLQRARATPDAALYSRVCFACQQAAEKALNAYLINLTGTYPRIHDLIDLFELTKDGEPGFQQLKQACEILDGYYLPVRYPSIRLPEDFSGQEAEAAIDLATEIVQTIEKKVG